MPETPWHWHCQATGVRHPSRKPNEASEGGSGKAAQGDDLLLCVERLADTAQEIDGQGHDPFMGLVVQ